MQKAIPFTTGTMAKRGVCLKSEAIEVPCPKCSAEAGSPCQGRRGPRITNHIQRHTARIAV